MNLKFTEFYWSAAGQRVFDVSIEGKQVLANFDIFVLVGNDRAYDISFPVSVTDGQLNLDFRATVDYAKLSGIVISESPSAIVAAINCGGGEYIDQAGMVYEADQYYDGGWVSSWGWMSGTDDVYL